MRSCQTQPSTVDLSGKFSEINISSTQWKNLILIFAANAGRWRQVMTQTHEMASCASGCPLVEKRSKLPVGCGRPDYLHERLRVRRFLPRRCSVTTGACDRQCEPATAGGNPDWTGDWCGWGLMDSDAGGGRHYCMFSVAESYLYGSGIPATNPCNGMNAGLNRNGQGNYQAATA